MIKVPHVPSRVQTSGEAIVSADTGLPDGLKTSIIDWRRLKGCQYTISMLLIGIIGERYNGVYERKSGEMETVGLDQRRASK